MTHRGGLSLSIIIWKIGGWGAKLPFALGPKNSLVGPVYVSGKTMSLFNCINTNYHKTIFFNYKRKASVTIVRLFPN